MRVTRGRVVPAAPRYKQSHPSHCGLRQTTLQNPVQPEHQQTHGSMRINDSCFKPPSFGVVCYLAFSGISDRCLDRWLFGEPSNPLTCLPGSPLPEPPSYCEPIPSPMESGGKEEPTSRLESRRARYSLSFLPGSPDHRPLSHGTWNIL